VSTMASQVAQMDRALDAGAGIVRLAPTWVPRAFCTPGRRIKLHDSDYFAFGANRGGIDERWLSSAVRADNGPMTGPHEGLSMVVGVDGELIPFDEFVEHHGAQLVGDRIWRAHQKWPMYSKFFDNQNALPLHVHHRDHHAALVGKPGKPEAYYFPRQMNNHLGDMGVSFFGLHPETTREQVLDRLARFAQGGDNRITELSRGYRIALGTGWDMPAGVLHAPASVCTYEPQADCDVFCMCESWSNGREVPEELLWKDVPDDRRGDLEFIVELLDWDLNIDPHFLSSRRMLPVETQTSRHDNSFTESWIVYRSPHFSATELTLAPGGSATVADDDTYGCIAVQGAGTLNDHEISSPTSIRFGEVTNDEFFVSQPAAREGVRLKNRSRTEPLVLLKHFGPGNTRLPSELPHLQAG
jgi:hypothetical protein